MDGVHYKSKTMEWYRGEAGRGMSSRNLSLIYSGPPPPVPTHRSRSKHSNTRHDLAEVRSRSPIRHRNSGSSRFLEKRERPTRRRHSPNSYDKKSASSKSTVDKLSLSSSVGIGNTFGFLSKLIHPSVSPVATISDRETIVCQIIAPENVEIPRRPGEGAKAIFDRDELRESIEWRIRNGDNDANPPLQEQRVMEFVREPMLPEHYLPSHSSIEVTRSMAEIPDRQKTSTGLCYRLKPTSSTGCPSAGFPRSIQKSVYDLEREMDPRYRFGQGFNSSQAQNRRSTKFQKVSRDKLLENRDKLRRRSRSQSVTPPPMPPELQRYLVSRYRGGFDGGFRSPGSFRSFEHEHDLSDFKYRGRWTRGFRRPHGYTFQPRSRGLWQ